MLHAHDNQFLDMIHSLQFMKCHLRWSNYQKSFLAFLDVYIFIDEDKPHHAHMFHATSISQFDHQFNLMILMHPHLPDVL